VTSERTEPALELKNLTKAFQDPKHPAVANLSLDVVRGETVALLGPSGCGKTTLLRLIAGFDAPDAGTVTVAGKVVAGDGIFVAPEARRIGFVFQDYALFPHLDVFSNIAFGLKGMPRSERRERVREVMDLVGLTVFARRYPVQLSGGQQQRVALARALAPQPDVLLLDEPFSNLDAALREGTRQEVRRILGRSGATTLLVTHDQEEAMTFADRLAVMRAGRLEQEGEPEVTYRNPRTAFVAGFLGRTNLLRGEAQGETVHTVLGEIALLGKARGSVLVSVRPEDLQLTPTSQADSETAGTRVVIQERIFQGHDRLYRVSPDGEEGGDGWVVRSGPGLDLRVGDAALLSARGPAVTLESSRS